MFCVHIVDSDGGQFVVVVVVIVVITCLLLIRKFNRKVNGVISIRLTKER